MASAGSEALFVTLEGVDGAGKSTHVAGVAQRLRARGRDVLVTREPGGTPLAEALRALLLDGSPDPITETLLMFAARADHVASVIRPALAQGRTVVCDRFTDASFAYQGAGKGVPAPVIEQLATIAHPGLAPQFTLVFDCPYEVSRARLHGSGRQLDRFEREGREYFERVRACYLQRAREDPLRVRLIDAARSLQDINNLLDELIASI